MPRFDTKPGGGALPGPLPQWLCASLVHAALLFAPALVLGRHEAAARPRAIAIVIALLVLAAIESKAIDRAKSEGRHLALASSLTLLVIAWIAIANDAGSSSVAWLGAPLAGGGIALRAMALRTLGPRFTSAIEPDPDLVVHGVYGLVRHPSELGLLLLGLGIATLGEGLSSAIFLILLAVLSVTRMAREELALSARFGKAHARYAKRTGLLLPRISI